MRIRSPFRFATTRGARIRSGKRTWRRWTSAGQVAHAVVSGATVGCGIDRPGGVPGVLEGGEMRTWIWLFVARRAAGAGERSVRANPRRRQGAGQLADLLARLLRPALLAARSDQHGQRRQAAHRLDAPGERDWTRSRLRRSWWTARCSSPSRRTSSRRSMPRPAGRCGVTARNCRTICGCVAAR